MPVPAVTTFELDSDQWLVVHDDDRFSPEIRMTVDRIDELLPWNIK